MLQIESVTKKFGGVTALSNVSFSVAQGEIIGLIGPNGAGKSTLINLISGLFSPDSGHVYLKGEDVTKVPPFRRVRQGMARTFQNIRLFGEMTVLENILVGQHFRANVGTLASLYPSLQLHRKKLEQEAEILLEEMDLREWRNHECGNLPLGIQRRVEIARALATDAKLLMLDEPTSGMLHTEQVEMSHEFRRLKENGKTIILIEHNMSVVFPISDRVVVINFGEKIAEGTPAEVQRDSKVLEAYLGS